MKYYFLKILIDSTFLRRLQIYILIFGIVLQCGCSSLTKAGKDDTSKAGIVIPIEGKEGTKHFIIIGFGIVSVSYPEGETAVMATNSQVLGINVSNQPGLKLGAGYSSSTVLTVPDGTRADDVRIEVTKRPFGLLKIITHSAKLKELLSKGKENEN